MLLLLLLLLHWLESRNSLMFLLPIETSLENQSKVFSDGWLSLQAEEREIVVMSIVLVVLVVLTVLPTKKKETTVDRRE